MVVPYIGHRVYSDLFAHLRREASSYEFTVLLAEGMGDPSTEKSLLSELRWRGVDGVVLIAPRLGREELESESTFHQPIVTIGMPAPTAERTAFARIEIDHVAGGGIATEYLLQSGRSRIAYLAGRVTSASDLGRRSGYRAALQTAGAPIDERLTVELERHTVQPWPDYELTSVGVAWYRVALAALEALIEIMDEGHRGSAPVHRFAPELVLGESVASGSQGKT